MGIIPAPKVCGIRRAWCVFSMCLARSIHKVWILSTVFSKTLSIQGCIFNLLIFKEKGLRNFASKREIACEDGDLITSSREIHKLIHSFCGFHVCPLRVSTVLRKGASCGCG